MLIFFRKAVKTKSANQSGFLFEQTDPVKGYVRKDGISVAPHHAKHQHRTHIHASAPVLPASPAIDADFENKIIFGYRVKDAARYFSKQRNQPYDAILEQMTPKPSGWMSVYRADMEKIQAMKKQNQKQANQLRKIDQLNDSDWQAVKTALKDPSNWYLLLKLKEGDLNSLIKKEILVIGYNDKSQPIHIGVNPVYYHRIEKRQQQESQTQRSQA